MTAEQMMVLADRLDDHAKRCADEYWYPVAADLEAAAAALRASAVEAGAREAILEAALRDAIDGLIATHDDETEVELLPRLYAALQSEPVQHD